MHFILMVFGVLFLVGIVTNLGGKGVLALTWIFSVLIFYSVIGLVLLWAVAYTIMHVIF